MLFTKSISDQFWRSYRKKSIFFIFHFLKFLPIYHYVLEKKLDVKEADIEFSHLHSTMVFNGAHIRTCAGIYGRNQTSYWHKLDSKKNKTGITLQGKTIIFHLSHWREKTSPSPSCSHAPPQRLGGGEQSKREGRATRPIKLKLNSIHIYETYLTLGLHRKYHCLLKSVQIGHF